MGSYFHVIERKVGGKARREGKGVTVTRRAMLQRWRLVRMGDGWDEAKAEDPRIWRYTFDGEKMHVQDGRFVFD